MKTKLFLLSLITTFCITISSAQRRQVRTNQNKNFSFVSYVVNDSYRSGNYSDRYRSGDYDRYDRYYNRMSRYDRKRLRRLIDELEDEKRRAFRDGHISRREDRRIYEVEQDIERLLYAYRRNDRANDRGTRYSAPRCR